MEWMVNTYIFKQLIKQFSQNIFPEIPFFEPRFNAQLLIFASYKPDPGVTIIDALRVRSLVLSNLRSETKGPRFEPGF